MPCRTLTYDGINTWWSGRGGLVVVPQDTTEFVIGQTIPVPGYNVGVDPNTKLTPYTGPNAGGVLIITAPTTFEDIDFGTTQLDIRSSDVHFDNCLFEWTKVHDLTSVDSGSTTALSTRYGVCHMRSTTGAPAGGFTNRTFFRCTFRNKSQWAPATVAAIGYGFTMERCAITGFGDCGQSICPTSAPDSAVRVKLLGCYLGELSFWWAPTKGLVHPSDDHSHSDCWQWQGGTGQWVEGCWIDAHYSTTVGTGTPNSGQDTAGIKASYAPYDQATGEAARYRIVDGGGTWATGPAAHTGGSLSGLMFSTSPAGHIANATTLNNWGSGGSNWLNAGDDALTGAFGTVQGNRVDNNQRQVGWALNIDSRVSATVADNYWTDGSGLIARRNG
jgi:hypothetical protein